MISSEYGWSTDQIFSISLREVNWRIDEINKRKQAAHKLEAALHGMELKGAGRGGPRIDDKAKAVFDKLLRDKGHGKRS